MLKKKYFDVDQYTDVIAFNLEDKNSSEFINFIVEDMKETSKVIKFEDKKQSGG